MTGLNALLTTLSSIDTHQIRYEHEKLHAIRAWALDHLGIDYAEGDRVRIKDGYEMKQVFADGVANGWWTYREALVPGALATVQQIDFNSAHGYWYADIRLDREWSVGQEWQGVVARYWNGPVADTPEGFKPPDSFNQERYPEGRKHSFSFEAEMLEKAP